MENQHKMPSEKYSFLRSIRKLEKHFFPEFGDMDIIPAENNNYFYFSPSWHFGNGLLTEEIVADLIINQGKMISVGSGPSYLERFMVSNMGLSMDQIVLADKKDNMPKGFKKHKYDMYKDWPKFDERFDYVVFPESVLFNVNFKGESEIKKGLYHILKESIRVMKPSGQVRINGHGLPEYYTEDVRYMLEDEHLNSKLTHTNTLIILDKDN